MGDMEVDGMMSPASGADAVRRFLEQMTVHHRGAVEMAETEEMQDLLTEL